MLLAQICNISSSFLGFYANGDGIFLGSKFCHKVPNFKTPNVELTGAARLYRAASSDFGDFEVRSFVIICY